MLYTRQQTPFLQSYADTDFATCQKTRKHVTGIGNMLGNNKIYWLAQHQRKVALSTRKIGVFEAASAAQHTLWIQKIQVEVGANERISPTICLITHQQYIWEPIQLLQNVGRISKKGKKT